MKMTDEIIVEQLKKYDLPYVDVAVKRAFVCGVIWSTNEDIKKLKAEIAALEAKK
jgi:hypothetical protein